MGLPTPSWPELESFPWSATGAAPGGPGPEQPETHYRWRRSAAQGTNDQSVSCSRRGIRQRRRGQSWNLFHGRRRERRRAAPGPEQPETHYRWRRSAAQGTNDQRWYLLFPRVGFANAVVARFGIFSMVGGESGAGRPPVLSSLRRDIVGGARQRRGRMIRVDLVRGVGFANAVVARFGIFSMVGGESGAGRPPVLSSLRRNIVGGSRQRRRVEAVGQISGAVVRWSWWDFQRRLQGGLARRLKRLRLQAMIARIRICRMEVVGRKLRGRRRRVARLPVGSRYRQQQTVGAVIGCS